MSTDLLGSIAGHLTPPMIQKVSALLGETSEHTAAAVDGAVPALLAGLMQIAALPAGPGQLLALVNRDNYGRLLNNLSGLCDEGNTAEQVMATGQEILRAVFADKLDGVSERVAAVSGVTTASALSLLSLTAPVVLGSLGRIRAVQGLNGARLNTLLLGQKEAVARLAPAGLAEVLGLSELTNLGPTSTEAKPTPAPEPTVRMEVKLPSDESTLKRWGWPLFGVAALGLLYFLLF